MAFGNGEIRPIYQQGTTTALGGIIIYMPERGNNGSISALNFNGSAPHGGSAACSFSLFRFTKTTGKKILLYSFELNAGDVVSDTVGYHLSSLSEKCDGDYFWLVSNSGHVNYTVEGLEYEQNTIQPPFGTSGIISVIDKYGQPKSKCCGSDGSGYVYDCIDDTITSETNSYYNIKLAGATNLKFIIVDKTLLTEIDGDFTFASTTGIITTVSVIMYVDSTIVIPFNRKL